MDEASQNEAPADEVPQNEAPTDEVPQDEAPADEDGAAPTDAEAACFEAGIKFGSLYHQFAGTPVSPESAASLARAMEEAIENQPYCAAVSVTMDRDAIAAATGEYGYTEFTGRFATVEIEVAYEGVGATARMAMEGEYPRMRLVDVDRA